MRAELKEYQAVEAAAMKFVKSVAEGNSAYAKELFTDEAVLFGYLDGKLEHGSIGQFYHNLDTVSSGDNFKARVDVLMVEESLAVVRVLEEGWGNRIDFTDVLLLLQMDGEWKCCLPVPLYGGCICRLCAGIDSVCVYGRAWRGFLYEHKPWSERGTQGAGDYW